MSIFKLIKKKIQPRYCVNYKILSNLQAWIEEIEYRLNNITIEDVTGKIQDSFDRMYNILIQKTNALSQTIKTESELRKSNDDFLQNQINKTLPFFDNLKYLETGMHDFVSDWTEDIEISITDNENIYNYFCISQEVVMVNGDLGIYDIDFFGGQLTYKITKMVTTNKLTVIYKAPTDTTQISTYGGSVRFTITSNVSKNEVS